MKVDSVRRKRAIPYLFLFSVSTQLDYKGDDNLPTKDPPDQMVQGDGILSNDVENKQMENPQATPISNTGNSEAEFWPLSGKPYFSVILTRSQVNGLLNLPVKISRALPSGIVPVILTYCGKIWNMVYRYHDSYKGRLEWSGWKTFVRDNNLEAGDACVFELEESNKDSIRFRVQILRGHFPPELVEGVNGETLGNPIIID